ncbi:MAG: hypothetical protein NTZ64_14465 [Polaromonas sp.]|nr:hypothetical protein [Polaromonas sp.]
MNTKLYVLLAAGVLALSACNKAEETADATAEAATEAADATADAAAAAGDAAADAATAAGDAAAAAGDAAAAAGDSMAAPASDAAAAPAAPTLLPLRLPTLLPLRLPTLLPLRPKKPRSNSSLPKQAALRRPAPAGLLFFARAAGRRPQRSAFRTIGERARGFRTACARRLIR